MILFQRILRDVLMMKKHWVVAPSTLVQPCLHFGARIEDYATQRTKGMDLVGQLSNIEFTNICKVFSTDHKVVLERLRATYLSNQNLTAPERKQMLWTLPLYFKEVEEDEDDCDDDDE
jgi:hypothetical protein